MNSEAATRFVTQALEFVPKTHLDRAVSFANLVDDTISGPHLASNLLLRVAISASQPAIPITTLTILHLSLKICLICLLARCTLAPATRSLRTLDWPVRARLFDS